MISRYFDRQQTQYILYPFSTETEKAIDKLCDNQFSSIFTLKRKEFAEIRAKEIWVNSDIFSSSKTKAVAFAIFCCGFLFASIYFSRMLILNQFKTLGISLAVVTGVAYSVIILQNTGKKAKDLKHFVFAWLIGPFYPLYKNHCKDALKNEMDDFDSSLPDFVKIVDEFFKKANLEIGTQFQTEVVTASSFFSSQVKT